LHSALRHACQMREHWVHVEQDFELPVERVYPFLSEHENLGPLFGAKITRIRDGETERNGVGSARLVKVGPAPAVEETVTKVIPNELIEYRITHGGPMRNHIGIMKFTALPGTGSHLDYRIRVSTRIPGLASVLTAVLSKNIAKGLKTVDRSA